MSALRSSERRVLLFYETQAEWLARQQGRPGADHEVRSLAQEHELDEIADCLKTQGYQVERMPWPTGFVDCLHAVKAKGEDSTILWNLTDGDAPFSGSLIPAAARLCCLPYVGSSTYVQALCQNKHHWKAVVSAAGLPTPQWCVSRMYARADMNALRQMSYPVFVKAAYLGDSAGLGLSDPLCKTPSEALGTADVLHRNGIQIVVIEEFLPGQEYSYAFVDAPDRTDYVGFQVYEGSFLSDQLKNYDTPDEMFHQRPADRSEVRSLGQSVASEIGLQGYGKIDIRESRDGSLMVMDVNAVPFLTGVSFRSLARYSFTNYATMIGHLVAGSPVN
jgi:D-alanine-D-alanine ligase